MFSINSMGRQTSSFLTISFVLFIVYLLITNQLSSFVNLMTQSNWSNMPKPDISGAVVQNVLQSAPAQQAATYVNNNTNSTAQQPGSTQSYSTLFGNMFSGGILQGLATIGQIGNKVIGNGT